MEKALKLLLIILFTGISSILLAQEKEMMERAEELFEKEKYLEALPLFKEVIEANPNDEYARYLLGICYLYKVDEIDKSVEYLEKVSKGTVDWNFYAGRAYHFNYRFDEGIKRLKKAHKKAFSYQKDRKLFIKRVIKYCENGKILVASPVETSIDNLGTPINSTWSEYAPLINADETMMVFTYRGEKSTGGALNEYGEPDMMGDHYEDVFISTKEGRSWTEPVSAGENINTTDHEAPVSLSADGQTMFIYKDMYNQGSGDIFISHLEGDTWSVPEELGEGVNSPDWDCSATLSPDGNTLFFSSNRPDGQGGKDLYTAKKQTDGTWGEIENMGPAINTLQDEDAPFIHPDSRTLYFSSQGHNSMGFYDIFYCLSLGDTAWSAPVNLGHPINTTMDDIYYVVAADGINGYYSSGKAGGLGQQDIYKVLDPLDHSLLLVKGVVTGNKKPMKATITVTYADGREFGTFYSNASTGKYLVNLPVGDDYQFAYEAEGYYPHYENAEASNIEGFVEKVINVNLKSKEVLTIAGCLTANATQQPVTDVSMKLALADNPDEVDQESLTDTQGCFKFANLPNDQDYLLFLDEEDIKVDMTAAGHVLVDSLPYEGAMINSSSTPVDGSFRIEFKAPVVIAEPVPVADGGCADLFNNNASGEDEIDLNDPAVYKEMLGKYGDKTSQGLIYKIQIGAYTQPQNFDYSNVKILGEVKVKLHDDGITRFTMGELNTLREAEELKQKILKKGNKERPFIIAYCNGERKRMAALFAGFEAE